jgi:hypothetical protein
MVSNAPNLNLVSSKIVLESGGWGDHVTPFHSPPGTAGEWMNVENDVFGQLGNVYTGPGKSPFKSTPGSPF